MLSVNLTGTKEVMLYSLKAVRQQNVRPMRDDKKRKKSIYYSRGLSPSLLTFVPVLLSGSRY